ncbi:MAG: hypothetical protein ABL894_03100 [Hyphomicrobium sp.]
MNVTYRLSPRDLTSYRYAVRDRLNSLPAKGILNQHWARAVLILGGSAGLFILLDGVLPRLTGRPLTLPELAIGFFVGLAACLAVLWLNYFDQSKRLVDPEGPALSEHTISLSASGLNVDAAHMNSHFDWPAIRDVSVERGLVILWLEPSMGVAIPVQAFAGVEARDDFVASIEARRTEAELPRAGSFSAS